MLEAIVFDFDGLILDTETLLYDVWREVFEEWGLEPITVEEWCRSLGRDDTDPARIDPRLLLRDQLGSAVDLVGLDERRRRRRDELLELVPLQPGVEEVLALASTRGLAVAIASSSPVDWVERHLSNHGLLSSFSVLASPPPDAPANRTRPRTSMRVPPSASIRHDRSPGGLAPRDHRCEGGRTSRHRRPDRGSRQDSRSTSPTTDSRASRISGWSPLEAMRSVRCAATAEELRGWWRQRWGRGQRPPGVSHQTGRRGLEDMIDHHARTKVVVIGGGYAGTMAANHLRRRSDIDITLVNPRPSFVERIRLHQLVAGTHPAIADDGSLLGEGIELVVDTATRIDRAGPRRHVGMRRSARAVPVRTRTSVGGQGAAQVGGRGARG